MNPFHGIGILVAVGLLAYLLFALVKPEKLP